jgi:regulator of replication initiation timing
MSDWTPLIVALIAALPGLYALISQSRKDNAEAVDAISHAAAQLVGPLKIENKELRERLAALEAENEALKAENQRLEQQFGELRELLHRVLEGCNRLCQQLAALGHEPVFSPAALLAGGDPTSWKNDEPGGGP